jgi:hypothetical protein
MMRGFYHPGVNRGWEDPPRTFADASRKHPHNEMNAVLLTNSVTFLYTSGDVPENEEIDSSVRKKGRGENPFLTERTLLSIPESMLRDAPWRESGVRS